MRGKPKKIYKPVGFTDAIDGFPQRKSYSERITDNEMEIPRPLEYDDIDDAFNEFADKMIDLVDDSGRKVPTFTLYSNQRFSEYSQTWEHTDEDGNLLMNFKTVNRQNNPSAGTVQGGFWNIPGNRRYTTHMKTVLDDSGREHVEIYSMGQPYCVDLSYRVNFVTNTYDMLNRFNERVHELFKARQFYIRPNGHFIPMVLEDVTDETTYSIDERKFFVQSVLIKAMAYIIHETDFEVKKFAKNVKLNDIERKRNVCVDIEDIETEKPSNTGVNPITLTVKFGKGETRVEFEVDSNITIENASKSNVNGLRVFVNGIPWFIEKGFELKVGDTVRMKINSQNPREESKVVFYGYETGSEVVRVPDEEDASIKGEYGTELLVSTDD